MNTHGGNSARGVSIGGAGGACKRAWQVLPSLHSDCVHNHNRWPRQHASTAWDAASKKTPLGGAAQTAGRCAASASRRSCPHSPPPAGAGLPARQPAGRAQWGSGSQTRCQPPCPQGCRPARTLQRVGWGGGVGGRGRRERGRHALSSTAGRERDWKTRHGAVGCGMAPCLQGGGSGMHAGCCACQVWHSAPGDVVEPRPGCYHAGGATAPFYRRTAHGAAARLRAALPRAGGEGLSLAPCAAMMGSRHQKNQISGRGHSKNMSMRQRRQMTTPLRRRGAVCGGRGLAHTCVHTHSPPSHPADAPDTPCDPLPTPQTHTARHSLSPPSLRGGAVARCHT